MDSPIIQQRFPLSFAQERLWLLQEIDPDCVAYNMQLGIRFIGPLDVCALQTSLGDLVERHEVLRAVVRQDEGIPYQMVVPRQDIQLEVDDVRAQDDGDKQTVLQTLATREVRKPFNLSKGPLCRFRLFRIDEREHLLVITAHHIVTDGWSRSIMREELIALYDAYARGERPQLASLPIQYVDFAAWQRSQLPDPSFVSSLAYWRDRLRDAPRRLELPTDHPRPARQSYRGQSHWIMLESDLITALKRVAQQQSATLFMALYGVFAALIARYTNSSDIVVGTPVAGRTRLELEGLVGFFVNMLALRTDLSGDPTFLELLQRVRVTAIEAYSHQAAPFEKVVNEMVSDRDPAVPLLFQVVFQLKNYPQQTGESSGLQHSEFQIETEACHYDLSFDLTNTDAGIRCRCDFATDLFEPATVERMLNHYRKLVEEFGIDPNRPLSTFPLLTPAERHQMLVQWNDTAVDYPGHQCLHRLFEGQVERTPDAIAVVSGNQRLTFRDLNQRANQLAHLLRGQGVGPETLVGISIERSAELVIGILGILKSGGAYLPMVTDDPRQRLEFILDDANVRFLITQKNSLPQLPNANRATICLDADAASIQSQSSENPQVGVTSDNLAYVMYTSGSTGAPKGVLVEHSAIFNHMAWFLEAFPLDSQDSVLQKTPVSSDASVWEFFAPLLSGARLTLASPGSHRSPPELVRTIEKESITVLQLVPSLLRALLNERDFADLESLRLLFSGGEELRSSDQRQLFRLLPGVQLINLYGPTETCIDSLSWWCDATNDEPRIPIGRPIANTQVYVLDQHGQPVPIGVPGELCIGGAGLARGYLNRPQLTAERFTPNPFDPDPNSRLYRSGDRCCWGADGSLDFLGRLDNQVKLRGFRIELGEIESVLNEHPDVAQSVVTLRDDHGGDKRLVAYCVATTDTELNYAKLRSFLQDRLPDHMLPAALVSLETFPLTTSGKIDRRALAEIVPTVQAKADFVAPLTPLEMALAEIWCNLLNLDRVGRHDDFFELGGHSLLAVQVISRIRERLDIEISVRNVFESPTITQLANIVLKHMSPDIDADDWSA